MTPSIQVHFFGSFLGAHVHGGGGALASAFSLAPGCSADSSSTDAIAHVCGVLGAGIQSARGARNTAAATASQLALRSESRHSTLRGRRIHLQVRCTMSSACAASSAIELDIAQFQASPRCSSGESAIAR